MRAWPVAIMGVLAIATASCASTKTAMHHRPARSFESCARYRVRTAEPPPVRAPVTGPTLGTVLAEVPPDVRRTVRAGEFEELLARLIIARQQADGTVTLELIALRQRLNQRVSNLLAEVNAAVFEADCTGSLIEVEQRELEDATRDRDWSLAVASIVVGSVGGIATGVWDVADQESHGPAILGLAVSASSAGVSLLSLLPWQPQRALRHERNLLALLRTDADPTSTYAGFVWRMMTTRRAGEDATPREHLNARWDALLSDRLSAATRSESEAILFGAGGVYDESLLSLRVSMFDLLASELDALHRDLEALTRYLSMLAGDA